MLQPSSLPGIAETFEILIGVSVSEVARTEDEEDIGQHKAVDAEEKTTKTTHTTNNSSCVDAQIVQSETSVKIAMEIVAEILPRWHERELINVWRRNGIDGYSSYGKFVFET